MPGAALELSLSQFAAYLQARSDRIAHLSLRGPLTAAKVLLVSEARSCFDEGRAPDGTSWLPLKAPSQRRGGASAKPLRDRGILMASVTAQGKGHVEEMTDRSLVLGTNLDYAAAQQWGHTYRRPERRRQKPWVFPLPSGKMLFTRRIKAHTQTIPARPFLGFSPRAIDRLERIFAEHLARQL